MKVSDSSNIVDHEDECVAYDEEEFPADISSVVLPCKDTKYGRHLSIQRTRGRQVHHISLCEVVVNGRPIGKQLTCIPKGQANEDHQARCSFRTRKIPTAIRSRCFCWVQTQIAVTVSLICVSVTNRCHMCAAGWKPPECQMGKREQTPTCFIFTLDPWHAGRDDISIFAGLHAWAIR